MAPKRPDEVQLSAKEATKKINEMASNLATRIVVTDHAYQRQTNRLIDIHQTTEALVNGMVSGCRCYKISGRKTYRYTVSYTDDIGPIRVVVRIQSEQRLVVITVIDAS